MTQSTPESMGAAWRRLCGLALLWASMAALVHVATSDAAAHSTIVALSGFLAFALGLSWFAESMKLDLLDRLRSSPRGDKAARSPDSELCGL